MSAPTTLEISTGTEHDLDVIYPRMLRDFPPHELKSKEQLRELIRRGAYTLYLARHVTRGRAETSAANGDTREAATRDAGQEPAVPVSNGTSQSTMAANGGAIAGYAFVYEPESPRMAWLDYLAIDAQFRDSGFGTRFVSALRDAMKGRRTGIVIEVEPPTSEDPAQRADQQRRIRFYSRLGAKQLDVEYRFPSRTEAYPLLLLFLPVERMSLLPQDTMRQMIAAAYAYIHHDVEEREAILRGILESARDTPL